MMANAETESCSTPQTQPERGKWLAASLLFTLASLILFIASLQYYWPGKWWGSASTLAWKGTALTLAKGRGYNIQGGLIIDGLAAPGAALASLSPQPFRAEDYPAIHWSASSDKSNTKVEFLWRTTENPNRFFARELEWMGNSLAPLHMAGDGNWRGQIMELALMVHKPLDTPLTIEAVEVEPPLGIVWCEWFGAEPWLGTSINFVGETIARQWLLPLPFIAAALGLALFGYAALVWRKILASNLRMVWALFFLAWFTLDMRWQLDLWHKLGLTQQRYAGKSWEDKHLAAEDGPLFNLMQQVRAKLPSTQSRVFLFADAEYIRGRGTYHLYPFNVLNGRNLLPAKQFKSGDFIVILGKDEVEFDAAHHLLKWGAGQQLHADLLLLAENNVLLRVR
ncbi:MAG: hypothetical protein A3J24_03365 [Deltaproteobacteria bacterium RIFCSPLOWO2_02_FULL_53_8]|nr:MAG: hypothetical protein A3J24_03365 [Deltaproteobacteria bacterium RIFCSPLOWO2_02_FULL_53_8]